MEYTIHLPFLERIINGRIGYNKEYVRKIFEQFQPGTNKKRV